MFYVIIVHVYVNTHRYIHSHTYVTCNLIYYACKRECIRYMCIYTHTLTTTTTTATTFTNRIVPVKNNWMTRCSVYIFFGHFMDPQRGSSIKPSPLPAFQCHRRKKAGVLWWPHESGREERAMFTVRAPHVKPTMCRYSILPTTIASVECVLFSLIQDQRIVSGRVLQKIFYTLVLLCVNYYQ